MKNAAWPWGQAAFGWNARISGLAAQEGRDFDAHFLAAGLADLRARRFDGRFRVDSFCTRLRHRRWLSCVATNGAGDDAEQASPRRRGVTARGIRP